MDEKHSVWVTAGHALLGTAVIGALIGGVLVLTLPSVSAEQCTASSGVELPQLTQAQRADIERRIRLHEQSLRQLEVDPRWQVPDQRRWLQNAMMETRMEIRRLEHAISESPPINS